MSFKARLNGQRTRTMEVAMPKHKNKVADPSPDSQPTLINRYLFPVTISVLLIAVAAIGWFLLGSQPWLSRPSRNPWRLPR
jgi:hypothetical protein